MCPYRSLELALYLENIEYASSSSRFLCVYAPPKIATQLVIAYPPLKSNPDGVVKANEKE
ncbi:MAG: hypothetical protein ACXWWC_07585 [Chitinophagaceae bacterium]